MRFVDVQSTLRHICRLEALKCTESVLWCCFARNLTACLRSYATAATGTAFGLKSRIAEASPLPHRKKWTRKGNPVLCRTLTRIWRPKVAAVLSHLYIPHLRRCIACFVFVKRYSVSQQRSHRRRRPKNRFLPSATSLLQRVFLNSPEG